MICHNLKSALFHARLAEQRNGGASHYVVVIRPGNRNYGNNTHELYEVVSRRPMIGVEWYSSDGIRHG